MPSWWWKVYNKLSVFYFHFSHQVSKVTQRISSQLYNALCEAAVMADEASEDSR